MQSCPHCRHETSSGEEQCSRCGSDLLTLSTKGQSSSRVINTFTDEEAATDTTPHEPIARFSNIAEAGYFHSELEGHLNCEVCLKTQDHFDAPSASWWSDYVLTVPLPHAEEAVDVMRQLVTDTDQAEFLDFGTEPSAYQNRLMDENEEPASRINWTPIILTVAAGTLVVWATKQAPIQFQRQVGREAEAVNLWDAMKENDQPWVQRLEGGRRRRELSVDVDRNVATLREDTDGDGIFDRVSHLSLDQ